MCFTDNETMTKSLSFIIMFSVNTTVVAVVSGETTVSYIPLVN